MLLKRHFALRLFPAVAGVFFCACGFAQIQKPTPENPYPMPPMTVDNGPPNASTPAPTPQPEPAPTPRPEYRPAMPPPPSEAAPPSRPAAPAAKPSPSVPANRPAAAPPRPVPYSILNTPAEPARVTLASGKLTIEATNSSLSSILGQIAKAGGMKIAGPYPNSGQRIFGKYGPGAPRTVLSDLLTGSGYNIMMLGITPAGTPRELSLSARGPGGPSHPSAKNPTTNQDVDVDVDNGPDYEAPQDVEEPPSDQPQEVESPQQPETPQPPSSDQNRVRTPEQILQELQQMHQQQQQQPQ